MWVLVHLPGCDLRPSFSLRVTYLFIASIFIFVLGVYIQEGNRIPSTKPTSRSLADIIHVVKSFIGDDNSVSEVGEPDHVLLIIGSSCGYTLASYTQASLPFFILQALKINPEELWV